jgi:hypothetical protein
LNFRATELNNLPNKKSFSGVENMEIQEIINELEQIRKVKSFNTRGLPFAKKMWRDGYNKALIDVIITFKTKDQDKVKTVILR